MRRECYTGSLYRDHRDRLLGAGHPARWAADAARGRPSGGLDLYTDSLNSDWESASDNSTIVLNNSDPVHDGAASIAVTYTAANGALNIKVKPAPAQPLAWDAYEVISFWANGGSTGGQQIRIKLVSEPALAI